MKYAKKINRKNHLAILNVLLNKENHSATCRELFEEIEDMSLERTRHALVRMVRDSKLLKSYKTTGYRGMPVSVFYIDTENVFMSDNDDWYCISKIKNKDFIKHLNLLHEYGALTRSEFIQILGTEVGVSSVLNDMERINMLYYEYEFSKAVGKDIKRFYINEGIVYV